MQDKIQNNLQGITAINIISEINSEEQLTSLNKNFKYSDEKNYTSINGNFRTLFNALSDATFKEVEVTQKIKLSSMPEPTTVNWQLPISSTSGDEWFEVEFTQPLKTIVALIISNPQGQSGSISIVNQYQIKTTDNKKFQVLLRKTGTYIPADETWLCFYITNETTAKVSRIKLIAEE